MSVLLKIYDVRFFQTARRFPLHMIMGVGKRVIEEEFGVRSSNTAISSEKQCSAMERLCQYERAFPL
jgi:hypothetical protein